MRCWNRRSRIITHSIFKNSFREKFPRARLDERTTLVDGNWITNNLKLAFLPPSLFRLCRLRSIACLSLSFRLAAKVKISFPITIYISVGDALTLTASLSDLTPQRCRSHLKCMYRRPFLTFTRFFPLASAGFFYFPTVSFERICNSPKTATPALNSKSNAS